MQRTAASHAKRRPPPSHFCFPVRLDLGHDSAVPLCYLLLASHYHMLRLVQMRLIPLAEKVTASFAVALANNRKYYAVVEEVEECSAQVGCNLTTACT